MGRCASCGESVIDEARFCMSCGAPLASDPLLTADVATPPPTAAKRPSSQPRRSGGSSGTGKSTVVSRQGGFLPGNLLAGRYRIVAVLGKGGMGEVYRADDLMLEQPVALKFLPEAMDKDEDALERFRNEIRVARRVSHPNVCRVYDVGEVDGLTFLSMEYVDGEDLASLLRRIGRLVGDKGSGDRAPTLCRARSRAPRRRAPSRSEARQHHARWPGARGRDRFWFGQPGRARRRHGGAKRHARLHGARATGRPGSHCAQ